MAHLGTMKRWDAHCMSAGFIIIMFFAALMLLLIQPSDNSIKSTMLSLPKDDIARMRASPPLPLPASKTTNKGSGKNGKKDGKGNQNNKNDKKANKAKLIKDELPKKTHNGTSSTAQTPKKLVKDVVTSKGMGMKNPGVSSGQAVPAQQNRQVAADSHAESPNTSKEAFPKPAQKIKTNSSTPSPISSQKRKIETEKASVKPKPSFSNLNQRPMGTFDSPYIDTKTLVPKVETKIITWFKTDDIDKVNGKTKLFKNCPQSECRIIYPLPLGFTADAIIFDEVDTQQSPPARAHFNQAFVFHNMNPPPFPEKTVWPAEWISVFNWTWTYRRDSDIWQPLGLLKKVDKVRPLSYVADLIKWKREAIAWIPLTCSKNTSSKRDEFVKELAKYIPVTEMGKCFNQSCAFHGRTCAEVLSKKFFFVLALEDDICLDHVTEVFYRAWNEKTHLIPIVRGGADYDSYFPDGSFIDADWFNSVKELSEFLIEVMRSKKLYTELLWRKGHWIQSKKTIEELSLCKLCHKLHHVSSNHKKYTDIRRWFQQDACKYPRPF